MLKRKQKNEAAKEMAKVKAIISEKTVLVKDKLKKIMKKGNLSVLL